MLAYKESQKIHSLDLIKLFNVEKESGNNSTKCEIIFD